MLGTVVDTQALAETVLAAVVAGVGVTLTFSLALLGSSQMAEATRDGRHAAAAFFALLAGAGIVATVAAIAFGLIVMIS